MKPLVFLRKLWQMNKALPVLLGALVLTALVLFAINAWVLTPDLEQLQRSYIDQRERVRASGPAHQGALAKQVRNDREDLAAFREKVGGYEEFTSFIGELFSLAERAGLRIDRVQYDPEGIEEHSLLRYDLSFAVSGDYGEIKKFIFSLEQSKRIFVIEEVSLAGGNQGNRSSVSLRVRLATYFATDNN